MVHLSGLRAPLESLSAVDGAMASQERELKYLVKNWAENPNWLLPTCEVHERNTPRMARCCVWSPVSYRSRGGTGSCLSWGWASCMPSTTCRQGWPRRSCLQPCWPHLAGGPELCVLQKPWRESAFPGLGQSNDPRLARSVLNSHNMFSELGRSPYHRRANSNIDSFHLWCHQD